MINLKENKIGSLIPEVQSNIGMGLRGAVSEDEVIAFPGRIIKKGREIFILSPPEFGASKHVAHIVLTVPWDQCRFRRARDLYDLRIAFSILP